MSNAAHPERPQFDEVMVPNYSPMSIIPVKGKGSRIWDQSDKDYIDFAGGIAVTCLGHSHPNLIKALVEQGNKLWHLSNVMTNEPALRLAKKLCEHTFADKVYFCNSGGEANEAALKLARRYAIDTFSDQKTEIITFHNAFHGRTFFTVCAGGQAKYSDGFGPKPGDITHIPFNNIEALELAISNRTCAVMIEPIQGEGGILPAEPAFLKRVRELCDKHKALLIMDEVQSGMGRTGKLFAYMQYDVTPDILTSAKGLGGGIPIGAMLTTDPIAKVLTVGTHGSTYGGNPLASAVSEAVLDTLMTPGALDGVDARSKRLVDGLNQLNDKHHLFDKIRGMGMLLGCVLKKQHAGKARDIMQAALAQGALVLMAGGDVVRFAPSLIMTDEEMDEGLKRLDAAFATISA